MATKGRANGATGKTVSTTTTKPAAKPKKAVVHSTVETSSKPVASKVTRVKATAAKVAAPKPVANKKVTSPQKPKVVTKAVVKKTTVKAPVKTAVKTAVKTTVKTTATPKVAAQKAKPVQTAQSSAHGSNQQNVEKDTSKNTPFDLFQSMFNGIDDSMGLMTTWQQFANQIVGMPMNPSFANLMGFGGLSGQAPDIANMVNPQDLERLQSEYMREMSALWQNYIQQQGIELRDKRFASPAWRSSAWANYLAQSYLINARLMLEMAECVQADPKTKTRVRFAVMQWVDSLSPSNFFLTNPEAQQKLIETQGESLKMGIHNFLTDLQKGRISQTDETAFKIGVNVARSDGAVIFENEYFQLLQYTPLTEKVGERPLLIVPPCINKYYILDLQPDNSLVRHAVESGNTVYLISWRNADEALAQTTWDDYIEDVVIRAIHVVQEASRSDQINTLGFCVGGTLLSTALAVLAARGESPAASLTLLTTLLDFSDNGVLDAYVDEQHVLMREQSIGAGGIMQGKELANAFATLRPNDLVWNYVVSNYLKGEQPTAFDLLYWNSDSTNLPGPMFCWYLRNTYLENRLIKQNDVICCGEKIDLSRLNVPTYVLSCREDHIVPWTAAFRSQEPLSGDKRFVLAASGHIAGVVNSAKKNKRHYWVNPKASLAGDPEHWLNTAQEHPGSWWTDWTLWLKPFAGKEVNAPNKLGTAQYKPIEAAPGRYVKARAA
ncbi:class I poly(R)-hydroxyalkanoic acid synthase [Hydromonas duriensis]|uniref:Polyhydroxyalkanoate synthase n=1 Tax=Hydromonas duriensis TaxID=1527608 RepID=A0A4R6YB10_9BURK|nr:class I poly(R)-hydroxyalkanoic acid synthase [Hydromonas duriensis]TDR32804.1 polyhydroxyalkanoate synthase [Hydromonas duriensis]